MKRILPSSLFLFVSALLFSCEEVNSLEYGDSIIHYTHSVTKAETASLGKYLTEGDLPIKQPFLVKLDKEGLDYKVYWAGKEDFRVYGSRIQELKKLADSISQKLFKGRKVNLWVTDKSFRTRLDVSGSLGNHLAIGQGHLYYQSEISPEIVENIGQFLLDKGYFNSPQAALIEKAGDVWYLKLENVSTAKPSGEMIRDAHLLRKSLEEQFFPDSWVTIEICNHFMKAQATISPDPYIHDIYYRTDKIVYSDEVLKRDAQKLGDFLAEERILRNTHKTVGIFKDGYAFVISFKALKGVNHPDSHTKARRMAKALSKHVFRGMEVKIHLYDRGREQLIFSSAD